MPLADTHYFGTADGHGGNAYIPRAAGIQREIGFMVAALKGMLRDSHVDSQFCDQPETQVQIRRVQTDTELLEALRHNHKVEEPLSLLVISVKHAIGSGTQAYKQRRAAIIDRFRENLRETDRIFELADETIVIALAKAKMLTGIIVAERIGLSLECHNCNRAPIIVSIGIGSAVGEAELDQILDQARNAMIRAKRGGLRASEINSLNFIMG